NGPLPETREVLCEHLLAKVRYLNPALADQVTDMLVVNISNKEIIDLLTSDAFLEENVEKIVASISEPDSELRESLGMSLFQAVSVLESELCAQVTGMLLELPIPTVTRLLSDVEALKEAVNKARNEYLRFVKMVCDWKNSEASLKKIPKKKCAVRTGICYWSTGKLFRSGQRKSSRWLYRTVTPTDILTRALKWSKTHPDESKNFKATANWCSRFMKRKNLVLWQKTKVAQKLPADLEDKIIPRYAIGLRKEHNYPRCQIVIWMKRLVFSTCLAIRLLTPKTKFSVVLTCLADGTKLKPMVIFKRKTMPDIKFPTGVLVHVHEKAVFTGPKKWPPPPGGLCKERSLLVWDMFRAHLTDKVKKHLQQNIIVTAVIPRGLPSVLQPLDVSLNKPFKDNIRSEWNKWMVEGERSFTKGGNMSAPPLDVLCKFVIKSWEAVHVETVVK
ncbi:Pogo transposable element-like 8, partial [Homarus americanus]